MERNHASYPRLGAVSIAAWGSIQTRRADQDAEAMAKNLQTHGAIVENYSKLLGKRDARVLRPFGVDLYVIAGILGAGGALRYDITAPPTPPPRAPRISVRGVR